LTWIFDIAPKKVREICGGKKILFMRAIGSVEIAQLYWKFTTIDRKITNPSSLRNLAACFLRILNWFIETRFYDNVVANCLAITKTFWRTQKKKQTKLTEMHRQVCK